jgi:hypothetical protein
MGRCGLGSIAELMDFKKGAIAPDCVKKSLLGCFFYKFEGLPVIPVLPNCIISCSGEKRSNAFCWGLGGLLPKQFPENVSLTHLIF